MNFVWCFAGWFVADKRSFLDTITRQRCFTEVQFLTPWSMQRRHPAVLDIGLLVPVSQCSSFFELTPFNVDCQVSVDFGLPLRCLEALMRNVFRSVVVAFALVVALLGTESKGQDYAQLFKDFTSSGLTFNERRYLQAALAFEGHYFGLLDGDWGRLSREAMQRYSNEKFGTPPEEWHTALLALEFYERYERDGWDMQYFPTLGMSLILPKKTLITDPPTDLFVNLRHEASSLSISIGIHDSETANSLHEYTARSHAENNEPYSVRKRNFAVSTAKLNDSSRLYTRSEFIDGAWSTVMVSASELDENIFQAVAASITKGQSQAIDITRNGKLIGLVQKTFAFVESDRASAPKAEPKAGASHVKSSGSGFVVSAQGHVLTNAHVVDGCAAVYVDGVKALVLDTSEVFDLALLKTSLADNKIVAVFSASPARLNSDVTVVGFPYAGLLGGLNVTRGAVSSLKGLGGDSTKFQITAPVQSGNSGGPLLAADGEVVGVVVSKLDALVMAENNGDVPQNVNFAIRGEIATLFLAQNQVEPQMSLDDTKIAPETLAQTAANFTSFIECK